MILAGGDIGPRDSFQLFVGTYAILVGAIVNANIFGNLAVLIQAMNLKQTQFQEKIDTANTAMKNMKLPDPTQKLVQTYIINTQSTLDNQTELDKFLGTISPSLRI